jgi:hypothetical protein
MCATTSKMSQSVCKFSGRNNVQAESEELASVRQQAPQAARSQKWCGRWAPRIYSNYLWEQRAKWSTGLGMKTRWERWTSVPDNSTVKVLHAIPMSYILPSNDKWAIYRKMNFIFFNCHTFTVSYFHNTYSKSLQFKVCLQRKYLK